MSAFWRLYKELAALNYSFRYLLNSQDNNMSSQMMVDGYQEVASGTAIPELSEDCEDHDIGTKRDDLPDSNGLAMRRVKEEDIKTSHNTSVTSHKACQDDREGVEHGAV